MSKFFGVLFLILLMSLGSFAQTQTIKGVVTDSSGNGIKGVNVMAKGNKKGTQTNAEGKFSINVKEEGNVDLILSAIGFKNAIVTANGSKEISVVLKQDIVIQDEVVVNVGYGTLKKREVSSSISSITAKDIKDVPINNAAEALTGRLAGVQVTTAEGAPDADVKVKVRGGGSITQTNDPLYIVDGVQVDNGLSTIAPQDIQSIDVLKDAAATAIYGARGANGVIIVTTKSGRQGRLTVNFNTSIGMKKLTKELELMDPYDFVFYQYEKAMNDYDNSWESFKNTFGSTFDTLAVYKDYPKVDWQKLVLGRTGVVANNSISVSGGSKYLTFTAGYTNNYEKAIVQNSNYKRQLFNGKLEFKPSKQLKFGASGRYIDQNVEGAGLSDDKGSSSYSRLRNAVKYRPFVSPGGDPLVDDGGDVDGVSSGLNIVNPIRLNNNEYRKKTTNSYNLTGYVNYNITKRLTFRSTIGYEYSKFIDRQFSDTLTSIVRQKSGLPIVELDTITKRQITNSNVLSYKISDYKKRHDIEALIGEETVSFRQQTQNTMVDSFAQFTPHDEAFNNTSLGRNFASFPKLFKYESSLLSFFSRINYTLDKKYVFSFNFRADGSSKFPPGSRWGYFPSGSFAWRVIKEDFMKDVKGISDLKLRMSYGTVGNNRIDDYLYLSTFANNSYYYGINGQPVLGYTPDFLPNDLLKWETTVSKNIGLDMSFLNDRFGLSVDLYENKTRDLLLFVNVANTYGYQSQLQNIGSTRNRGIEIQLNAGIIKTKDFSWNATFNISSNQNIITSLGRNLDVLPAVSGLSVNKEIDYLARVGDPVGSMYGYVTDGYYKIEDFNYDPTAAFGHQYTLKPGVVSDSAFLGGFGSQPGSIKFKDLNGDGKIDNGDNTVIGNAQPKFSGGLNQQFTYKNWDMSIFINFVSGNQVLNGNKIEFTNAYSTNSNMLAIMNNRWRNVNDQGEIVTDPVALAALNANANIWSPITSKAGANAFKLHSWAIEDGSFIRINNISIGYNFPARWINKVGIKKLRAYVTGNNLAVFTKYTGYDPEVNVKKNPLTPGVDYSAYPKSRLYMFGLNVSF
jgi:TonB-dependent starch-binding outer membrane protein SusC